MMLHSLLHTVVNSIPQLEWRKGKGEDAEEIEASINRLREISEQLKAESAMP